MSYEHRNNKTTYYSSNETDSDYYKSNPQNSLIGVVKSKEIGHSIDNHYSESEEKYNINMYVTENKGRNLDDLYKVSVQLYLKMLGLDG